MNSSSAGSPHPADDAAYRGPFGADTTFWGLIDDVQSGPPQTARDALLSLLGRYTPVMRNYLRGLPWRLDEHGADDIVQGFLQAKFLEGQLLEHADQSRGRFRTLLKVSLDNYVRDRLAHRSETPLPQARGADSDAAGIDSPTAANMPDRFDAQWACTLLHDAIERLRIECIQHGNITAWRVFEGRLLRPIFSQSGPRAYERLAADCGLGHWKEAANALVTAKRMFRRIFERLIKEYSDADPLEEVGLLMQVFSSGISLRNRCFDSTHSPAGIQDSAPFNAASESWIIAQALDFPTENLSADDGEKQRTLAQLLDQPLTSILDDCPANAPETLLALFTRHDPPFALLDDVKNWAKRQAATNELNLPRDVLSLIYFASIAAARQFCQRTLSGLSDNAIRQGIAPLLDAEWSDPRLTKLLRSLASPDSTA